MDQSFCPKNCLVWYKKSTPKIFTVLFPQQSSYVHHIEQTDEAETSDNDARTEASVFQGGKCKSPWAGRHLQHRA